MKQWVDKTVAYLDWVTLDRDLGRDYARRQAEKCLKMGANVHCYFVQAGGPMIYPSRVSGHSPHLKIDLLDALIEEDRKRGIRFVAGWLGTLPANALQARERPDWIARDAQGHPLKFVCYNSPFKEHQMAEVREVLAGYEVDGVYFDQVMTGCFCESCRREFELMFHRPMPVDEKTPIRHSGGEDIYESSEAEAVRGGVYSAEVAGQLRKFADNQTKTWLWNLRRLLDSRRPGSILVTNHLVGERGSLAEELVDVVVAEQIKSSPRNLPEMALERQLTTLYSRKVVWEGIKYDNYGFLSRPAVHGEVLMAETVANGNNIFMRDQDTLSESGDQPAKRARVMGAMRQLARVQIDSRGAQPLSYAAVVHSLTSSSQMGVDFTDSFTGMSRFLMEHHIPHRMVSERDVWEGGLDGHRMVIVPNARHLDSRTLEALKDFVGTGAAILATGQAILGQEPGSTPLGDLVGVKAMGVRARQTTRLPYTLPIPVDTVHRSDFFFGRAREGQHPVLKDLASSPLDFHSWYIQCDADMDAAVMADILDYDQEMILRTPFNRRMPMRGEAVYPLLLIRETLYRSAYFALPICQLAARENSEELDQLLLQTIRWLGGQPPLETSNVPASIRVVARQKDDTTFVHLNNLGASPMPFDGVIRYIIPVENLKVSLETPAEKVIEAVSLTTQALDIQQKESRIEITVPRLDVYEVIALRPRVSG